MRKRVIKPFFPRPLSDWGLSSKLFPTYALSSAYLMMCSTQLTNHFKPSQLRHRRSDVMSPAFSRLVAGRSVGFPWPSCPFSLECNVLPFRNFLFCCSLVALMDFIWLILCVNTLSGKQLRLHGFRTVIQRHCCGLMIVDAI
jgi:hypothetical protein